MRKINIIILAIFILACCVKTNEFKYNKTYNDLMSKQLKMMPKDLIKELNKQKVIIIDDPTFVDTVTIDGREVSKVVISEKLIPDPEKRYFISHLIRNILIDGAIIYNYDEEGNNFVMHPAVEVGDDFIISNKDMICNVIYYLLHKDYFNLHDVSFGILNSSLLASINNEISQLETRLLNENALILISVPYYPEEAQR